MSYIFLFALICVVINVVLHLRGDTASSFESDDSTESNVQYSKAAVCKPMVNIDGTPMVDEFDLNGNPFGVTEIGH